MALDHLPTQLEYTFPQYNRIVIYPQQHAPDVLLKQIIPYFTIQNIQTEAFMKFKSIFRNLILVTASCLLCACGSSKQTLTRKADPTPKHEFRGT